MPRHAGRHQRDRQLEVIEGEADDLIVSTAASRAFVWATAATFSLPRSSSPPGLAGLIHVGEKNRPAGRVGEAPALGLGVV
jgi:tRNA uridine 5-carboxymethylaminomethyl modification enzyme